MFPQPEEKPASDITQKLFILAHIIGYLLIFSPCVLCAGVVGYWYFYPKWETFNHHRLWKNANIQDYELSFGDIDGNGYQHSVGLPLGTKILVCNRKIVKIGNKSCNGEICTQDPIKRFIDYADNCDFCIVQYGEDHYPSYIISGFPANSHILISVRPTTCSSDNKDLQIFGE
jgi:hypothetical protein